MIASEGVAGMTHRRVAQEAGVSLAATTYHFETKADIVAAAAERSFADYDAALRGVATRWRESPENAWNFHQLLFQLIAGSVARSRPISLAWYEIVLHNTRRQDEAYDWLPSVRSEWLEIANAMDVADPEDVSVSAVDMLLGLVLMTLALRPPRETIAAILLDDMSPLDGWRDASEPPSGTDIDEAKANESRERILNAGIKILMEEGAAGVTHRAIAAEAGLTHTAITYYFRSIDELLSAAQERLVETIKSRVATEVHLGGDFHTPDDVADLASALIIRDATEHRAMVLASYSIVLEAARRPELRKLALSSFTQQYSSWQHLAEQMNPKARPLDGLLMLALYSGKLLRILSNGSDMRELAAARRELVGDFRKIADGRFWI